LEKHASILNLKTNRKVAKEHKGKLSGTYRWELNSMRLLIAISRKSQRNYPSCASVPFPS
jgi:hypothetical protein